MTVTTKSPRTGEERLLPSCCFHGLLNQQDNTDFSGMGLTIIGNMVKGLNSGQLNPKNYYRIALQMSKDADFIPIPWPGMPTDKPVPLNLDKLPFDYSMFLDPSDLGAKRRIDRVLLMQRIDSLWTPHIRKTMKKHGAHTNIKAKKRKVMLS